MSKKRKKQKKKEQKKKKRYEKKKEKERKTKKKEKKNAKMTKKGMVKHPKRWNQIKRRLWKLEMLTLQTKLQEKTKTASTQRFSMCTELNRSSGRLSSSASTKATPTSRFDDFGTPKMIARPPFPPGYLALAPTDFRLQMTLTSCSVLPKNV
jgi:hypothetical protein